MTECMKCKTREEREFKDLINVIDEDRYNLQGYENFRKKYVSNLNGDSTEKLAQIIKKSLWGVNKEYEEKNKEDINGYF